MPTSHRAGPKGTDTDVRAALLEAGAKLYQSRGLQGVSLREVAEQAGVNQAMVRYYFRDKSGFERAMLDAGCERLISAVPKEGDFETIFRAAVASLNGMPWLPVLIVRTVHFGDSLREYFVATYVPTFVERLGRHVARESKFGFMAVLSLLVMPQITRNLSAEVLGIEFDDAFPKDYARYVNGLMGQSVEASGRQS